MNDQNLKKGTLFKGLYHFIFTSYNTPNTVAECPITFEPLHFGHYVLNVYVYTYTLCIHVNLLKFKLRLGTLL